MIFEDLKSNLYVNMELEDIHMCNNVHNAYAWNTLTNHDKYIIAWNELLTYGKMSRRSIHDKDKVSPCPLLHCEYLKEGTMLFGTMVAYPIDM